MFSQQKSFWKRRWFLLSMILLLCTGYWFSRTEDFGSNSDLPKDEKVHEMVNVDTNTENPRKETIVVNPAEDNGEQEIKNPESFFLIKEMDDTIQIFFYEGEGEPVFVKNADIAFSLLSEADQEIFTEGVILKTEEELEELLQDFGS